MEARKENEILQEKIVWIYASALEKFGSYALSDRRRNNRRYKTCGRLKCYGRTSKKLRVKLQTVISATKRLRTKLTSTRRLLKEKSEKYDSINRCFAILKQEMETTEANLNSLIAENMSLRKNFEDTKERMGIRVTKERCERTNTVQLKEMQRNRELSNLKKKVEEDLATIAQLRNKLLRLESANANKGFLLNSYKSQLVDLGKEKERQAMKIKGLESEINALRTGNAQLKAKVTLLNNEKEKTVSESNDSETKPNGNYEESTQQEIDAVKTECSEIIKLMKTKVNASECRNAEYSTAIKKFLRKIYEYYNEREMEECLSGSDASEREARETACNILNMTPEQLSAFMKGKSPAEIDSWLAEFSRITSKNNFADDLMKFLLRKTARSVVGDHSSKL